MKKRKSNLHFKTLEFPLVVWKRRTVHSPSEPSRIRIVEAPDFWSDQAVQIASHQYLRPNEKTLKGLFDRVVSSIGESGRSQGYFLSTQQQLAFQKELYQICVHQVASFNSPVWFNVGRSKSPQASACFILKPEDSIEGIFKQAAVEAQIFRKGSGAGSNFSIWRSQNEKFGDGGVSPGIMPFLKLLDQGAGAIKSGGFHRRSAKMAILDVDHPDILKFISWKSQEEEKMKLLMTVGWTSGMSGEAAQSVSGQNANLSVRVTNSFLRAVEKNSSWKLSGRKDKNVNHTLPARKIWDLLVESAWRCADPGLQFHNTINDWHTCPHGGPIRSSNPCSEFMFLDDSACNLASLNLVSFLNKKNELDFERLENVVRILFIAQDILISLSGYPTENIRKQSLKYRPLGIGFTNLGALLMRMGLPYDSDEARQLTSLITSIITRHAFETSLDLAQHLGTFPEYKKNQEAYIKILQKHKKHINKLYLGREARKQKALWSQLIQNVKKHGLRNSQVSLIAPTGTISFMMDCDTTGIEPEFFLLKKKTLAAGGQIQIVNQSVKKALKHLGYSSAEIDLAMKRVEEQGDLSSWVQGGFNLKKEHIPIFDTALPSQNSHRMISANGHLKMMAAVQPFISGAISKTINLPPETTKKEIDSIYLKAWKLGLKSIAIYRSGSKANEPLSPTNSKMKVPSRAKNSEQCAECQGQLQISGSCFVCQSCGTSTACS